MVRLKLIKIVFMVCGILMCSSWMPLPMAQCPKKPHVGIARKEDVPFPYIKCQVCEKPASELYRQVVIKKDEISPKKIIEIGKNVCNLKKAEADWIPKIDIVEQGDRLELVEQPSQGQCNSECKKIERACQEVIRYSDADVAEYIYSKMPQLDALIKYVCEDLTKACSSKPPPVPKSSTLDDWKQKITKAVADAPQPLKRYANKVSNKVKQLWKTSKISGSANKPKAAKSGGKSEL